MKLVVDGGYRLYALLYAACTYASNYDPSERINEYLIANEIVPPNIRSDNQQPNVWRDYQQVLSELGFMYSTQLTRVIIPTAIGLTLLDNQNMATEIITQQVLLYQYPNGGKREYADEQLKNNVLLRPAVFVWRVLSELTQKGEAAILSSSEIRDYLMRSCRHSDAPYCTEQIINYRKTGKGLPINTLPNAGRNAADWIALLSSTLIFKASKSSNQNAISLSPYAFELFGDIDVIMNGLEDENTFWRPAFIDNSIRREWYSFYGASRFDISLPANSSEYDEVDVETNGETQETNFGGKGDVQLREFDSSRLNSTQQNIRQGTVESSYDSAMVGNKHRLHDSMVIFIANICRSKGAQVFEDPKSIDLLIKYENIEYLIEVKSVDSKNYIKRLRYAVGQLLHYDYMLKDESVNRRKVLGVPCLLTNSSSFTPFFTDYLGMDLLSLVPSSEGQILKCYSHNDQSLLLFSNSF